MSDSQCQQSFASHSAVVDGTAPPLKGEVDSELQFEPPDWGQEEEWRHRLHCLQECICELLIKNQQLRMTSVDSTTDGLSKQSIPLLQRP